MKKLATALLALLLPGTVLAQLGQTAYQCSIGKCTGYGAPIGACAQGIGIYTDLSATPPQQYACVQNPTTGVYGWTQTGGGGGGATLPATTNLIVGNGAGGAADSGISTSAITANGTAASNAQTTANAAQTAANNAASAAAAAQTTASAAATKITSTSSAPQVVGTTSAGTVSPAPLSPQNLYTLTQTSQHRDAFYAVGAWPELWFNVQQQQSNGFTSFVTVNLTNDTHFVKACWTGTIGGSVTGAEGPINNSLILQATISYPGSSYVQTFTVNGQTEWLLDKNAPVLCTDALGFRAPNGATTAAQINTYVRVPQPPAITGSAIGGGALSPNTAYYYKATCVDRTGNLESIASSAITVTTTGANLGVIFNITPSYATLQADGQTTNCNSYNIYKSTTNAAGSFLFLKRVLAAQQGNTRERDDGIIGTGGLVPPATMYVYYNSHIPNHSNVNNNCTSIVNSSYTSPNAVGAAAGSSYACWTKDTVFAPVAVLSDDPTNRPWMALGDSRLSQADLGGIGQFIPASDLFEGISWFTRGMYGAGKSSLNIGLPASHIEWTNLNTNPTAYRNTMVQYAYGVIAEAGINGMETGDTWQFKAAQKLQEAWGFKQRNMPYIPTTLEPVTKSTDDYTTLANQTPDSWVATRTSYNDWIRAGGCVTGETWNPTTSQYAMGTPAAPTVSGSSFTCPAGSAPTVLFAKNSAGTSLFWDQACTVEVNASGQGCAQGVYDGQYWTAAISSTTPAIGTVTGTLQSVTNASTMQLAAGTYTSLQYTLYAIKMTSGAASGQVAVIFTQDTAGNVGLFGAGGSYPGSHNALVAFTTTPAAGDSYQLIPIATTDGLHGSNIFHQYTGYQFQQWITANLNTAW